MTQLPVDTYSPPIQVLVTGASNQIGQYLLPLLQAQQFAITAFSRQSHPNTEGLTWQTVDLNQPTSIAWPELTSHRILFHLAPLPLLSNLLPYLPASLNRIIAFSSTSCLTKRHSQDPKERELAQQLSQAEQKLIQYSQLRHCQYTLFRPTLIYGAGRDRNITLISQFIERFGFFPLVGKGQGLRQPVHAQDLALACLQSYNCEATYQQIYQLSGGQTLTYREMVTTIFQGLDKKPHFLPIPLSILTGILLTLRWLPYFSAITPSMLARMEQDLQFDHSPASQDFGYNPRPFTLFPS